ncbi:MAG: DUF1501 domain-containing protein [Pirellulales bacterium]
MSLPRRHHSRRTFLTASTCLGGGLLSPLAKVLGNSIPPTEAPPGRAKSTILFFLCGGSSHIDMWDMKPTAPLEYRGPFQPIATSAPGIHISEHLPLTAKQMHHLAIVRSVSGTVNTNDHHAGYYYQLTGHVPDVTFQTQGNDRKPYPDDWPFVGSVVGSRKQCPQQLPSSITLPHKPSKAPYTRPGQFAARLGAQHDPLYVIGEEERPTRFTAPALTLSGDVTPQQLLQRQGLLEQLHQNRDLWSHIETEKTWKEHQKRGLELLLSARTTTAFDLSQEKESLQERYGKSINGMSLLLARRLVEAEVPFITVFWKENEATADRCKSAGGWDTHANNFECLEKHLLPEFDRGFSALVEDLQQRGLLDQTLLLVTSEMGRKPKIGDPRSGGPSGTGRDHWTHCMSVVMGGGGIRGGNVWGSTDRFAEYPADQPVTPADIAKTVYAAMGISNLDAVDAQGRPYRLLEEGHCIDLF